MKKKVLSLFLVVALLVSLGLMSACGTTVTPTAVPSSAASSSAAPSSAAPESAAPSSAVPSSAAPAAVEPLEIRFSSTFQEAETGGQILKHFIDKVGELSGGAITVKMSWGGTLFPSQEELDAVADGSVNMVALGHMPHLGTLTYLNFPSFAPGGTKEAVNYFQTLMFDDPETSKLIQDEASALGIKYLNVIAGGANAFCSKNSFADIASLAKGSASFGNFDAALFEALGFKVTVLAPPDVYDALNRGLIDATQMGFAPMVALSWYEVAPYWALDGTYAAGNFFTVNLKWWNALSDAQRIAIQDAATETQVYSETIYDDAIAADIAKVEEKTGNKFVAFSDADLATIWKANFEAKVGSATQMAETAGKSEGMIKILEKAAEITGYDWKH